MNLTKMVYVINAVYEQLTDPELTLSATLGTLKKVFGMVSEVADFGLGLMIRL